MPGKRRTRAEWVEEVRAWRASGLTCRKFARRRRLNASTLSWWACRLGSEVVSRESETREVALPFVEVTPVATDNRVELEVGDIRVRVANDFDVATLARVLEVLKERA